MFFSFSAADEDLNATDFQTKDKKKLKSFGTIINY